MKNELQTPSGRVMFIRAPKRLSPAQIAQAMASMSDDDPRWLAINQMLDEELAAAMFDSSSADLPDSKVRHAGGQVSALSTLKQKYLDARKLPNFTEKTVGRKPR